MILQHLVFFQEYIVGIKTCLIEPVEIYAVVGESAERTAQQQNESLGINPEKEFSISY